MREARILLLMAMAIVLIVANYAVISSGELHYYSYAISVVTAIKSYISYAFIAVLSLFGSINYYAIYVYSYYAVVVLIILSVIFGELIVAYKYLMFLEDIVHLKSFFSIPRDCGSNVRPMSHWMYYKVSRALRIWTKRNNNMLAIQLHDKNENGTITVRGDDAITAMRMFLHMSIEDINKDSIKRAVQ